MKALLYDGNSLRLVERQTPAASGQEALIHVRLAGICETDLEILKGYMKFRGVPGHEFVGEVAEGPVSWIGHRVVGSINCSCGTCELCRSGLANHCSYRSVLGIAGRNGVFAQFVTL